MQPLPTASAGPTDSLSRRPALTDSASAPHSRLSPGWRLALPAVLLLAVALRLWGAWHDLPFSYYGDELHFMKRAMALGTGDLNPHWFHKPAFLMYILAFFYGLYFAAGLALGQFESTAEFGAHFLTHSMPFLLIGRLVVVAFGVATVYLVYRIARKVYGDPRAGVAAALAAAVLTPMVQSSLVIKSDVPCGFLITLSIYLYLGTRDTERLRPLVLASLVAGAAMGTHYYGVVLVPAYAVLEGLRGLRRQTPWGRVALRWALVGALFVLGFFVTAPYNFLDPTWGKQTSQQVLSSLNLGGGEPATHYEPDSGTEFKPGAEAWWGAGVAFLKVAAKPASIGVVLGLLALLGLALALLRRETRWYGLLALIPCLFFFFAAITVAAYHAQPRHLNAIYPLLATLIWPGALAIARLLPAQRRRATRGASIAVGLAALACLPTLIESVAMIRRVSQLDSRLVSYRWIQENLPREELILVDEYGPVLNPSREAVGRLKARLAALPESPFIHHQDTRLDLLGRYPSEDAMNFEEIGHQWWLPREKTDAELASNEVDLDMGNPLISREPQPLAHYRGRGIRYVITNHDAQEEYFRPRGQGFPRFVRFYQELRTTKLVQTFDPDTWGGKGPTIWVYDISQPAVPGQEKLERIPKRRREVW